MELAWFFAGVAVGVIVMLLFFRDILSSALNVAADAMSLKRHDGDDDDYDSADWWKRSRETEFDDE